MARTVTDVMKMLAFQQRERKVLKIPELPVAVSSAWAGAVSSFMVDIGLASWTRTRDKSLAPSKFQAPASSSLQLSRASSLASQFPTSSSQVQL
jgi:hypothetical protein